MRIDHDLSDTLQAAVWLINSQTPHDALLNIEDLDDFWEAHDYTGRYERSQKELLAVQKLRPKLYELLTVNRDSAADLLNPIFDQYSAIPQLVKHEPRDWHFHVVSAHAPFAQRILVDTAMAVATLVISDELSRIRHCDATNCSRILFDTTKNRSRRFCSVNCANRMAVAAYRGRQAT